MRFLMLFLRLVLCAVCLFALCPSVPQATGAIRRTAFPSLPRSAYRSGTAACWPLPAPLSARPRGAGMPPQRAACAAAAVGVGALWRCLVHCRHACRARRSHRPCLLSQRRGGHAPALPLHLKRSIRPGDGSPQNAAAPGTLYRSRGYIYHVLGLCGACRIARILFCRGVFLQLGKKTAHGPIRSWMRSAR